MEIEPIPCGELNNFFGGDWYIPILDVFREQLEPALGSSIESDTPDQCNCAYSRSLEFAPRKYEGKRGRTGVNRRESRSKEWKKGTERANNWGRRRITQG